MKKRSLATIIGVAIVLAIALVATPTYAIYGIGGEPGWLNKLTSGCECPGSPGCTCNPFIPGPYPCFPDDIYDGLRSHSAYVGEDDDYFYFKATITDTETMAYSVSSVGSYYLSYSKDFIDAWIAAGCQQ